MADLADPAKSEPPNSHREILRSSVIIGGSSAVNIVFGIARTKVAALLLGPTGVGLISIYQTLVQTGGNLAALGMGTAGTREVAAAHDDAARLEVVRRALFSGSLALALLGALTTFVLRAPLARWLLGDEGQAAVIGWLALGVALSVAGGAQMAFLVGRRQIGAAAWINIIAAIGGSVAGIAALWLWGIAGLVPFVLAPLVAAWLAGIALVTRKAGDKPLAAAVRASLHMFRAMLGTGLPFAVAGVGTLASQLAARAMIQRALGVDAVGQFQASFLVSVIYVGFVLQAMGADYFPRLTAAIGDRARANRLIDEQTEVALLIAAPVLLGTLGAATWLIPLLYSDDFGEAAQVLRWQVLADLFKVASWPLGYVILARGAARTFMVCELGASAVLLGTLALLLPRFGIEASGIAVLASYAIYLPVVLLLARRATGFSWSARIVRLFVLLVITSSVLLLLGRMQPTAALVAGASFALAFAWHALMVLNEALPAPVRRLLALLPGRPR